MRASPLWDKVRVLPVLLVLLLGGSVTMVLVRAALATRVSPNRDLRANLDSIGTVYPVAVRREEIEAQSGKIATALFVEEPHLAHLRRVAGADAIQFARATEDAWECVCGARSEWQDSQTCPNCGRDRDSTLVDFSRESLLDSYLDEFLRLSSGDARQESPHDLASLPRVRLNEVCDSVFSLIDRRCQHAGVSVRRQWDSAVREVRADEPQIRQVILNLVLNALDAMPAGGVVTASTRAGENGTVRFSVSDTGTGVHVPEDTDVFQPFVTTKAGGVGLGLYVCRRNVERHRGRIGYDSSDKGTTFWFELPAADCKGRSKTAAAGGRLI